MQSSSKESFHWVRNSYLFYGIFLFAAGLRYYQLDRTLGGGDENAMLLYFGYRPLRYIVSHYFEASNHIFHSILVHVMSELFGEDNELAIRFPSFLFGLASLWMIYQVAKSLFQSVEVALASLFIVSINPIHIYYSQTARGYSLLMFFSIVMIHACIKILGNKDLKKNAFIFVISGFFSLYTLPTNIFFAFGLAGWILIILLIPFFKREFNLSGAERRKVGKAFLVSFFIMGVLTYLAYLPLMEQMIEVSRYDIGYSKNFYKAESNSFFLGLNIINPLLFLIFKGPLKWFIPFLVVGVFLFPKIRNSWRALPICLLTFPILLVMITGVAGYPRNYLYNLPLLVIFLSAGLLRIGHALSGKLMSSKQRGWISYAVFVIYILFSLKILFIDYYPSVLSKEGRHNKKALQSESIENDLILISDAQDYLYAREIYRDRLQNIVHKSKLSGIKLFLKNPENIENYKIPRGKENILPFRDGVFEKDWKIKPLSRSRIIASLKFSNLFSLLPNDFAALSSWNLISGRGQVERENSNIAFDGSALRLLAEPDSEMILFSTFPKLVTVRQESLVIFTWAGRNDSSSMKVNHPELALIRVNPNSRKVKTSQIPMGEANDGINVYLKDAGDWFDMPWALFTNIGRIKPGTYSMAIFLKVPPGNQVWYDGFHVFLAKPQKEAQ